MFCRNCSNEMNDKSIVCIKCGCDPFSEKKFCNNCGVETNENQIVCIKCGVGFQKPQKKSNSLKSSNNEYDGFYRSSDEKIILGVCGGLAHKFDIQLGLVRVGVFISLFFFIGWFYLGGFFIPKLPTKGI
jgi:phage shock protein PspC (stress-responsive transcriptional regulator)